MVILKSDIASFKRLSIYSSNLLFTTESIAREQCNTKVIKCGSIKDIEELSRNLLVNCVPEDVFDMDHTRYAEFLEKRRILMSLKIKKYYNSL